MKTSSSKRRRPDRRSRNPPRMREGENDQRIVRFIYEYRVLSQQQIEVLLGRSRPTVQRLLRRLYDHRYLNRVFLPIAKVGSSPIFYILDERGKNVLREQGIEEFSGMPGRDLSSMYLEHTQAINDFRIAMVQSSETRGWSIPVWHTENEIKADYDRVHVPGKLKPVALVPDGYFQLMVPGKGISHFFLELDRGTMTRQRFTEKVSAYITYLRSGAYSRRYKAKGFRVLTVVDGVGRRRVSSLVGATSEVKGIGNRFWFTHLSQVMRKDPLYTTIWSIAGQNTLKALFNL